MLLEQRLPRREEHRAADVQPDPLAVVPPGRVDNRAVALRRRPAGFCRAGGGGGRALSRLAVFVVVVIVIVVAVVLLAAAVRGQRGDLRRFQPLLRRGRHHETAAQTPREGERGRPSVAADASVFSSAFLPTHRHTLRPEAARTKL